MLSLRRCAFALIPFLTGKQPVGPMAKPVRGNLSVFLIAGGDRLVAIPRD